MKKIMLMLVLVAVFSLVSCSTEKKITDEQVLDSLKSIDYVADTLQSVELFTVKSRVLSEDKKTETIKSELVYASAFATVTTTFTTTCTKDKEGWSVDNSVLDGHKISAFTGPTDQEVFEIVEALKQGDLAQSGLSLNGKSMLRSDIDLVNNSVQYTVQMAYEDPYVAESGSAIVSATYDSQNGWSLEVTYYTVTRVWFPNKETYKVQFTQVVSNDKNARNFEDIYFSGYYNETYTMGGYREEVDQLYLGFEDTYFKWHGILKQADSTGSNLFILKYGASSTSYNHFFITYDYAKQEFYATTVKGSSGYFKVND